MQKFAIFFFVVLFSSFFSVVCEAQNEPKENEFYFMTVPLTVGWTQNDCLTFFLKSAYQSQNRDSLFEKGSQEYNDAIVLFYGISDDLAFRFGLEKELELIRNVAHLGLTTKCSGAKNKLKSFDFWLSSDLWIGDYNFNRLDHASYAVDVAKTNPADCDKISRIMSNE